MTNGAVVALSGGQDSATCLFYARERYDHVEAVMFDYGQRHAVEMDCAAWLATRAGVHLTTLAIPAIAAASPSASLTNAAVPSSLDAAGTGNDYAEARALPSSFVPGRNVVLLGTAAAFAASRGCYTVVTGVCAADRAGYPDCRAEFVSSFTTTLQVALAEPRFVIDAPLLWASKADTWALAADLGVTAEIVERTHTCYEGDHHTFHEWGYGCGECPACHARAEGFAAWAAR